MAHSLSGMRVTVETIIFLNPYMEQERRPYLDDMPYQSSESFFADEVVVPEGHVSGGVRSKAYNAYRQGLDSACADVVITTILLDGDPAVLASKRAPGKLFGNKWWMQGGAIHSYRLISDFLLERAEKECGVRPVLEAFMGVFRTCADDLLGSTTNLCYVGFIEYQQLVQAGTLDHDHTDRKLLTLNDLYCLSEDERHWYPMFAFEQALITMPS